MGDETKHYTVQIKGTAYRFTPFSSDHLGIIHTLGLMGDGARMSILRECMHMAESSLGKEQWAEIIGRVQSREIKLDDLASAVSRVMDRQVKDSKDSPPAGDA